MHPACLRGLRAMACQHDQLRVRVNDEKHDRSDNTARKQVEGENIGD